ncbi:MAG: SUMF1/EgtB/PvdO family nonheme iron enzyme [Cytophagales bacterium]|nr:SUMF1/EgtB/PvdO family nonheme iron enzyme [Cytophagales bacterium]
MPDDQQPSAANNDNDHLGYGAYANSLWARIQSALAKDQRTGTLGDDPLVVGIFGEWGAGKSKLLSLLQDKANKALKDQQKNRQADKGFGLTVPVFFQPWKYEYEEHLHVPLMMHIVVALQDALRQEDGVVKALIETAKATTGRVTKGVEVVNKAAKVTKMIYPWVRRLLGSISVFGVSVQLPELPEDWLKNIEDAGAVAGETSRAQQANKNKDVLKHTNDGHYFYRINELLKNLTRPAGNECFKEQLALDELTKNTRINFVIFIDDLDRCLPENAVKTLELIKTIFNVESFAFVLALDDEVIERGIGHRYKEYKLQDKKPEMPITGFEYLEKIVHVPFRLPALTALQAQHFVREKEFSLKPELAAELSAEDKAKQDERLFFRWGYPMESSDLRTAVKDGKLDERATDLTVLLLAAFDQYVPRKLERAIELMYRIHSIKPLPNIQNSQPIDRKIVFALLLFQLFQPELYRVFRRRETTFKSLLLAFYSGDDLLADSSDVAEMRLWQWASFFKGEGTGQDAPYDHQSSVKFIATLARGHVYAAQQVRLPLAERLVEHLKIERHAFNPFKLLTALAQYVPQTAATQLQIRLYLAYLSDETKTWGYRKQELETGTPLEISQERRERLSLPQSLIDTLFDRMTSRDLGVQSEIADILKTKEYEGKVLSKTNSTALHHLLNAWINESSGNLLKEKPTILLSGLVHLAPYLAKEDGEKFWSLVQDLNDGDALIPSAVNTPTPNPKLAARYADVRSLLAQDKRFEPTRFYLLKDRWRKNTAKQEPIVGFVRVAGGEYTLGEANEKDNQPRAIDLGKAPFYMARTLTTVDQYAAFIEAGGYSEATHTQWWDAQGWDWVQGRFDSKVEQMEYEEYLARRSGKDRRLPWDWEEQRAYGSRPVHGVTWFEARAYARWLNAQLQSDIAQRPELANYQVSLPAEAYWERAARQLATGSGIHSHQWVWGDDASVVKQYANIDEEIGRVSAVGCYAPNPLGLLDMAGNVWEWQNNLYEPNNSMLEPLEKERELIFQSKQQDSELVALRGGSWIDVPENARVSYRPGAFLDDWGNDVGFRVMLSPTKLTPAT